MKIIGITGGVGSGKSRVLSYIEETFPCVICQADHVAWELQRPGEDGYVKIVEHFGKEILNEDQTINRPRLGQIVFSNEQELLKLAEQVLSREDLKHCPHGRPICITLSKKQLEKQFKRS